MYKNVAENYFNMDRLISNWIINPSDFVNRLGGLLWSVLASSAEGRGFDHRPAQTKDIKIGISFFSAKHAAFMT